MTNTIAKGRYETLAWLFLMLVSTLTPNSLLAQKPSLDTYYVTVVTQSGTRMRGILVDVTANTLTYDPGTIYSQNHYPREVALATIRKVILRRTSKRRAIQAGALVGALAFGFLSVESLKKNPASNSVTYSITVLVAAGGGAAVGLVAGSVVGNVSHRVIRPRNQENGLNDFYRQLEPFSVRYQNNVFNRVYQ